MTLLSMETPRSLSAELVPNQPVASLCHCKALFLPRCRALCFSLNCVLEHNSLNPAKYNFKTGECIRMHIDMHVCVYLVTYVSVYIKK